MHDYYAVERREFESKMAPNGVTGMRSKEWEKRPSLVIFSENALVMRASFSRDKIDSRAQSTFNKLETARLHFFVNASENRESGMCTLGGPVDPHVARPSDAFTRFSQNSTMVLHQALEFHGLILILKTDKDDAIYDFSLI